MSTRGLFKSAHIYTKYLHCPTNNDMFLENYHKVFWYGFQQTEKFEDSFICRTMEKWNGLYLSLVAIIAFMHTLYRHYS